MKMGTPVFNRIYSGPTARLSNDLVGREAAISLFSEKYARARELRFEIVPNTLYMYDEATIPLTSKIQIPSTTDFNMVTMSGNIDSLEETLNLITNVDENRPEVIRVIKSEDNSAYAIFTK